MSITHILISAAESAQTLFARTRILLCRRLSSPQHIGNRTALVIRSLVFYCPSETGERLAEPYLNRSLAHSTGIGAGEYDGLRERIWRCVGDGGFQFPAAAVGTGSAHSSGDRSFTVREPIGGATRPWRRRRRAADVGVQRGEVKARRLPAYVDIQ